MRARESTLTKRSQEEKELDPDSAIRGFLRKYYQQDDGEMMDLKSAGRFEVDSGADLITGVTAINGTGAREE